MEEEKNKEMPHGNYHDDIEPKKEKAGMKLSGKIWLAIALIIVFILAVQIAVADKYRAQVLVIEGEKKVGVNPTTTNLDFGDLSADTAATRYVSLNAGGMETYIYVLNFGSIAELIKLNENGFSMQAGEDKKLEFTLYMPSSAPVGTRYTGHAWIFKIPKFW